MTATLRIQHIATGAEAVTIQVLQTQPTGEPLIVSDHTLRPGETHHASVLDGQRIVIIEPAQPFAPTFAEQLRQYRERSAHHHARDLTDAEINRALQDDQLHA